MNFNQEMNSIFLMYDGDQLISMLTMFVPTAHEAEITALTLPTQRRKGYFKELLSKAVEELIKYEITEVLFVVESHAISGKQVSTHLGAQYDFTEYSLRLDPRKYVPLAKNRLEGFKPSEKDLKKMIDTSMRIFEDSYEDTQGIIVNILQSKMRDQYLGLLNDEIIGMGSSSHDGDEASIFGFGIIPEFRGKGYGYELLHMIVEQLRQSGIREIVIEVDSNNKQAFNLYQKFGFQIETAFEYYRNKASEL
ncbi:GNAT family N-acetyltransferase [Desulfosporosinus fructosivorans]|uniref:GNAT family N-acetyltransferase n=2 Tax=Desulfosporosinus fructosivorans TaxID=2018669 RepID=A0A4Z0R112_9FIRM|nr:GNAT family N-acetyltransferase [Desulfosporosinus fructosivorans]